ncbi:MAG TPA: Rieske 2Fe-2S domain-containing protein, partial [Desulfurivibrionaceae bacterium]|nr:Rieske 2Fe-2S domain-containing protein [Desulfurivibrionaceae bacterium]
MSEDLRKDDVVINAGRRRLLVDTGLLLKVVGSSLLFLPILKFVDFRIRPRPRLIKVNRLLRPGGFLIEPEFVIFDLAGGVVAVSRRCTHLGCRLNFNEQENLLVCPCHQSRFTRQGQRMAGPARRDLPL